MKKCNKPKKTDKRNMKSTKRNDNMERNDKRGLIIVISMEQIDKQVMISIKIQ